MEPNIITSRVEPKIITNRVEPNIITNRVEPNIITTRATRLASREEEAALRKHGREGLLLRSRACAGLLFAFFYSLLSSRSRPTRELVRLCLSIEGGILFAAIAVNTA